VWSLDDLRGAELGRTTAWITPSVRERALRELELRPASPEEPLAVDLDTLVVIGGGTLIDRAKALLRARPEVRLVAVPSIWGSGAEVSPVIVLDREGSKEIVVDRACVPAVRVAWPELARTIPPQRARQACGDSWAHALEGFLSPLAGEELRAELADLMKEMTDLPLEGDGRWFEASARACAGQARSSVGLVHGIAHTLEGPLRSRTSPGAWHHARLCAVFLLPVMRYNREASGKWSDLLQQHGLEPERVLDVAAQLFEPDAYAQALPLLAEHWRVVLRDPCTRTNSVLVRPQSLTFLQAQAV